MQIWVHRLLGTVLQVAAFFGGAFAGWFVSALLFMALAGGRQAGPVLGSLLVLIVVTCFFGGAWLGRNLSYGLFNRHVSARCSQCGGRTYLQSEDANRVRYLCRSCGHATDGSARSNAVPA
jgi:hypothetical protein